MAENVDIGWWQRRLDKACTKSNTDVKDLIYDGSHSKCIDVVENCDSLRLYFDLSKVCDNNKSKKSLQRATSNRLKGNKYFGEKNFLQALKYYNQGITHAPHQKNDLDDNDEYTLCLANRSAVLFHLSDYQSCLMDIEESLRRNYQPKYKLLIRKANSLCHLQQYTEARICCEVALENLESCNGEAKLGKTKLEIQKLLEKMEKVTVKGINEKIAQDIPKVKGSPGSVLVQASKHIKLNYNPVKGRHLLSKKELEAGDVLVVEKPYAALLLPPHYNERCYCCLKALGNVFYPCPSCVDVRFCTTECCKEAMLAYHGLECPIMHILHEVGVAHLALRLLIITKPSNLLALKKELPGDETFMPSETSPLLCNYEAVYHLLHNTNNISSLDLLQYTMTSILLLRCLDMRKYFDCFEQISKSEIRSFIGGLLLRHICQLVCNAHAITDLKLEKMSDEVESEQQVRIATAIYPTVSMMNHSCVPNISTSFVGDVLVVKASSHIEARQEIFNCYGPHHRHMGKRQRQEILKEQYGFICSCLSCSSEKDTDFNQLVLAFKCPGCQGKVVTKNLGVRSDMQCLKCHETFDEEWAGEVKGIFEESSKIFQQGISLLEQKNIRNAKKKFERSYKLRTSICHDVNMKLAEVIDALAQCFALDGDFMNAEKHLKCSLSIIKEIYGSESLEYGYDLRKYVEVCIQAGKYVEAQEKANESIGIFIRYHGEEHSSVQELRDITTSLNVINMH